ncbi:MAG: hypothetical protein UHN47_03840 [Lachnospiraceae bacterium]|nr:hypothetical protein [Lachnospiraceae bacterium]
MEKQVELIEDINNKGQYLNQDEYLASPIIGYFHIYENGDVKEPPFGAVIVRTDE